MRFMRSPLAPKKMMLQGSPMRFESSPARSGLGRDRGAGKPGRMRVAAEELSDTGGLRFDGAADRSGNGGPAAVVDDYGIAGVAAAQQPRRQVCAHGPKSGHPDLHELPFSET